MLLLWYYIRNVPLILVLTSCHLSRLVPGVTVLGFSSWSPLGRCTILILLVPLAILSSDVVPLGPSAWSPLSHHSSTSHLVLPKLVLRMLLQAVMR